MRTTFRVGDVVRANTTAQGMIAGALYQVAEIHKRPLLFGVHVQHRLEVPQGLPNAGPGWVVNLHLLAGLELPEPAGRLTYTTAQLSALSSRR
jgi:hypothetical protein